MQEPAIFGITNHEKTIQTIFDTCSKTTIGYPYSRTIFKFFTKFLSRAVYA